MLTLSVYFFVTSQLIVNALAYKILICNPQTGYSHVAFLGQIADILVEAGHEVVSLRGNKEIIAVYGIVAGEKHCEISGL
ncbi:unnamed protein product [Anisakis simplex]|uniref:Glucuronosyltransferase n=1 Tax=Anisakis simplex TaxID=6269 RepID=A0A0M3K7T4_ANISI|nr:unnamed protein product [Anisakis simplex]